ncbi:MAG: hypothetical protein KDD82_21470, partial [Planctomycetes bacterium]|nr:hypothetical protein [Planctomycetota bacterium]
ELDPLGDAQALAADTAPLPLKLAALADFLASPLQAWAKHRLGLRGLDEDDPLSAADEPFASSALDATVLLREVFFAALGAVPAGQALETADLAQAYDAARLRYELAGRLPTGVFLQVERARHLSLLEAWLANVTRHPGDDALRGLASYSFGQAPRGVPGAVLAGPLELEVELEGAPRLVQLHGATQRVLPGCAGSLQLALGGQRAVHYLRGFLDHVVLAAAGHACAHEAFQVLVSPGRLAWLEHPKNLRAFRPFAADDARAYLRALIEDFLGGGHGYLFPVEAVQPYLWAWHEQGAQPADSLAEAIEALCRDAFRTHSGKHGPLAQLGRYRAPARAEDLAWARFGPYVRRRCEGELSL